MLPNRPDLDAQHQFVAGRTRSGKTTYAVARAWRWPGPVLFVNTQDEDLGEGWWRADPSSSAVALIQSLKRGQRIDYLPSADDAAAAAEIGALVERVFVRAPWRPPLLFVVDETHVYAPNSGRPSSLLRIARRGLRWGVVGLWISQRPADVSKGLVSQCASHVLFPVSFESDYLSRHGLPGDEIRRRLAEAPPYSYLLWDQLELTGPFREEISRR